ncbi:tRNA methyltransferase-like protein [Phyllosticta citriasiana]|uniref:tRNA methyltransferase-like protein n=1 Tax=Phyllosticta citriasiana TaxID=595635 RepID=A0ABR1KU85_9PEZI
MQHPYQCLLVLRRVGSQPVNFLLAASSCKLLNIDLNTGNVLVSWSAEPLCSSTPEEQQSETPEGPPGKKRKVSQDSSRPNIIKLTASHDGAHVVAITGEDKCVRVFAIAASGELQHVSERCMPKRPCAVIVTEDDQTIITADKFGDVYALPLLQSQEEEDAFLAEAEVAAQKKYAPAATNLTVHTGRNRKALEAQLKQQQQAQATANKTKEPLKFKHELLLGHVSMLTDVAGITLDQQDLNTASNEPASKSQKSRSYLLTADRDEHVRVSRGQPQTHVIEGFCLGHKDFVSKICFASAQVLVSGGGDDELFVWDWIKGRLLNKISIQDMVQAIPNHGQSFEGDGRERNFAVSGIWGYPKDGKHKSSILVALEGIPALFAVDAHSLHEGGKTKTMAVGLAGNVIDVAVDEGHAFVSVDNVHAPGSTSTVRSDKVARLQALKVEGGLQVSTVEMGELRGANDAGTVDVIEKDRLGETLYGVSKLRKRGGEEP